jgi:hypothetical protein
MLNTSENIRRLLTEQVNHGYSEDETERHEELCEEYGYDNVFSTEELQENFSVESFCSPLVFVTRKSDRVRGSLQFTHSPRFYFSFRPV